MSKFLYLFRSKDGVPEPESPEEMERKLKAWMSWMEDIERAGHLVARGERLEWKGRLVSGTSRTVTDGPYAEAKDTIGGYLIVQARDLEQAVELTKGCPLFDRDGLIEVRPILSM